jgi:hypothetical protein
MSMTQVSFSLAYIQAWYEMLSRVNASGIPLLMDGEQINPMFQPFLQSLV